MWTERPIEEKTFRSLVGEFQPAEGRTKYGLYTAARKDLIEQILPNIRAVMPDHTDHGPEHLARVLNNIGELLEIDSDQQILSSIELYSLILGSAFHDTGNIYGRRDHQRHVADIYDFCRSTTGNDHQEKLIVIKIAEAHCGTTMNGSADTLKAIGSNPVPLFDRPVRLQWIAAILRFADELAEGKERTSLFMLRNHKYRKQSRIFHEYVNLVTTHIDPGNERIALTYNIDVKTKEAGGISPTEEKRLKNLLRYCYQRVDKLDQERQYTKHYCDLLSKFKYTSVSFNFWIKGQPFNLGLPEPYTISDLTVPGDREALLCTRNDIFMEENILAEIRKVV